MSLLFAQRGLGDTAQELVPTRPRNGSSAVPVDIDTARRNAAVWSCLRLRADMVSSMPVQAFRNVAGTQVGVPLTPFLVNPDGSAFGISDWLYRSQVELDSSGNAVGIIRQRDGAGKPAQVELVSTSTVTVKGTGPDITEWKIGKTSYDPADIWHERQYPVAGFPLGLSPIAYAALTLNSHKSAQEFALEWFTNGAISPSGHVKNTAHTLQTGAASKIKEEFKAAVQNRDVWVSGADWTYEMFQADASQSQFLDTMAATVPDVCRFLGVPADMIDAESSTGSITYANVTQRNLQFLILNLGPAVMRREWALSTTLAQPRFATLNEQALLRMDPQSRATMQAAQVTGRLRAPSEVRLEDNLPPFTEAQYTEFDKLFPPKGTLPADSEDVPLSTGATP